MVREKRPTWNSYFFVEMVALICELKLHLNWRVSKHRRRIPDKFSDTIISGSFRSQDQCDGLHQGPQDLGWRSANLDENLKVSPRLFHYGDLPSPKAQNRTETMRHDLQTLICISFFHQVLLSGM